MHRGVGISGMGRIGRLLVRKMLSEPNPAVRLRAINSVYPVETIAHLLKYDSVHGSWKADILVRDQQLVINGHSIQVVYERAPENIKWHRYGVELAIDATGKFNDRQGALKHMASGAKRVLITAPGKQMDLTIVMGVNDHLYRPEEHQLLSAASCTTNCVAPVLHVLDQAFHIQSGWMTTVHSYTSDQNHLDNPHEDLRRARSCTQSIVPTTTGVGKALADVLPHLSSRIQGMSLRVPTQDVSLIDLTIQAERRTTAAEVNEVLKAAAEGSKSSYIGFAQEPLVSADYIGCSKSAMVDGLSTMVMDNQIKVIAWYDNEWAYACRVMDVANLMMERVKDSCEITV